MKTLDDILNKFGNQCIKNVERILQKIIDSKHYIEVCKYDKSQAKKEILELFSKEDKPSKIEELKYPRQLNSNEEVIITKFNELIRTLKAKRVID